jgi:pimeloyl-ACP methyl ester carboxylesterase
MPSLQRPDGVEIDYSEHGSGPLVVLAAFWSTHPSVFDPLIAELEGDHRVVRYDDRGAGASSKTGPYDMETAAADLEALLEHLGPPAVVVAVADGANRAVRVGAGRAELIDAIVCVGGPPIGRSRLGALDAMITSEVVVDTLLQQVETDYRGALRSVLSATNRNMTEDELRERVAAQIEHSPAEAAVARLGAYAGDDPFEHSVACGPRLHVLVGETLGGPWFPSGDEASRIAERELPEAHVGRVSDGVISRPDQTAAVVRELTAARRASAVEN